MVIIFGTRGRIGASRSKDIISGGCPSCGKDLHLQDLRRWFTLYFIPVIPLDVLDSFYKCEGCEETYKKEIKDRLASGNKERKKIIEESQKIFVQALAAGMTQMAVIDGTIGKEEKEYIQKIKEQFPAHKKEIEETVHKVSKGKSKDEVEKTLLKAREVLTTEGIMILIGSIAKTLLADGHIDNKEETLMKEYLLLCGVPQSLYPQIIEKVKQK